MTCSWSAQREGGTEIFGKTRPNKTQRGGITNHFSSASGERMVLNRIRNKLKARLRPGYAKPERQQEMDFAWDPRI